MSRGDQPSTEPVVGHVGAQGAQEAGGVGHADGGVGLEVRQGIDLRDPRRGDVLGRQQRSPTDGNHRYAVCLGRPRHPRRRLAQLGLPIQRPLARRHQRGALTQRFEPHQLQHQLDPRPHRRP